MARNIASPKSREDLEALLTATEGPVVLDFIQKGCGACTDDAPNVKAAAQANPNVTVIKVDANAPGLSELADAYGVDETPTLLLASSGADMMACSTDSGKCRRLANGQELAQVLQEGK